MAHFFKDGLIWAKLMEKIIFLFILMGRIIEDSLDYLKKMEKESFFIILELNLLEIGKIVYHMEKIVNKFMKIKVIMKASL